MQRLGSLLWLLLLPAFGAVAGERAGAPDCWSRFDAAVSKHEADAKAADDAYDRALRMAGGPALQRQWALVRDRQRQAKASREQADALDRYCSKLGPRADPIPANHGGT